MDNIIITNKVLCKKKVLPLFVWVQTEKIETHLFVLNDAAYIFVSSFLFTETVFSAPILCPRASHTLKLCPTPGLLKGLPAWLHFQTASDTLRGLGHNSITLSQLLWCWLEAACAARCQSAHVFYSQPAKYFRYCRTVCEYQVWTYMQLDCFVNDVEDECQDQTEAAQHLPKSWLHPQELDTQGFLCDLIMAPPHNV